jgi:hypothetical protein
MYEYFYIHKEHHGTALSPRKGIDGIQENIQYDIEKNNNDFDCKGISIPTITHSIPLQLSPHYLLSLSLLYFFSNVSNFEQYWSTPNAEVNCLQRLTAARFSRQRSQLTSSQQKFDQKFIQLLIFLV